MARSDWPRSERDGKLRRDAERALDLSDVEELVIGDGQGDGP